LKYRQEIGSEIELAPVGQGELHQVGLCEHLFVVDVLQKQQVDHLVLQMLDENRLELECTQQHELQNCLWELVNFQLESLLFRKSRTARFFDQNHTLVTFHVQKRYRWLEIANIHP
jgi:hypothetical protein